MVKRGIIKVKAGRKFLEIFVNHQATPFSDDHLDCKVSKQQASGKW
jgi:hypothetical protein